MSRPTPIIYTWTDEAPALATHAFLPVVSAFAGAAGVPIETRDISLSGRVLAAFADRLPEKQRTAVFCRSVLGMPYAELAELLESSQEAARRNVHEGLKTLRGEWSE